MDDDKITGLKTHLMVFDWREIDAEGIAAIRETMKKFGLHMYSDPKARGSDAYVFLVSNRKLDQKQVREELNLMRM